MISLEQFDQEVRELIQWMEHNGTPDDVQEKVLTALSRLRSKLWPEVLDANN